LAGAYVQRDEDHASVPEPVVWLASSTQSWLLLVQMNAALRALTSQP
jgi:hypothetical protein